MLYNKGIPLNIGALIAEDKSVSNVYVSVVYHNSSTLIGMDRQGTLCIDRNDGQERLGDVATQFILDRIFDGSVKLSEIYEDCDKRKPDVQYIDGFMSVTYSLMIVYEDGRVKQSDLS